MQLSRPQYALAASIAALVVAAPLAFHLSQLRPDGTFGEVISGRAGGNRETQPAEIAGLDDKVSSGEKQSQAEHVLRRTGDTEAARDANERAAKSEVEARPIDGPAGPALPTPASKATDGFSTPDGAAPFSQPEQTQAPVDLASRVDSLEAVGGEGKAKLDKSRDQLAAVPPPAEPAKPLTTVVPALGGVDARAGRGMPAEQSAAFGIAEGRLEADRNASPYDPYAHMDEAERQRVIAEQEFRDKFEAKEINPVKQVTAEPVSTFSIDVDTASYSFVRRALNAGRLPPKDSVRVEEMINYFPYAYPKPETAEQPFQPTVTVLQSPWNPVNQLVHVAIKGYDLRSAERPRANLVFLIDVSGSMTPDDKLPLLKNAFKMLVDELKPDDSVGIVTYASGSGVLLEPTKISDRSKILTAIERLGAGGSTAGAEGIQDAYRLAEDNFDRSAVNRVILATDGDFNVGVTNQDELKGLIERKRENGIFLSILGVGQGNYNDSLMQTLAQNGNGTAAYVDTLNEARKVLVDEASSTLFTIAKDVKVQIEWNPARISEYRLIGYETRALKREDFNNDKVDAGDIGSGHTVTAIYEVTPAGAPPMVDDLRYGKSQKTASAERAEPAAVSDAKTSEIGFLKLRYKLPKEDASKLVTMPIASALGEMRVEAAPTEARFSVAVAAFGQLLKGAPYTRGYSFDDVIALAQASKGDDPFGYRAEFINLVRLAKSARP